jgi:hypothetical protein
VRGDQDLRIWSHRRPTAPVAATGQVGELERRQAELVQDPSDGFARASDPAQLEEEAMNEELEAFYP